MRRLKSSVVIVFFIMVLLSACGGLVSKEEYIEDVQKSEIYNKETIVDGYKIKAGIRPAEYLALQEIRNMKSESDIKKMFEKEVKNFDNGIYLDFSIRLESGEKLVTKLVSTPEEYSAMIGELNYLIKDNLYAYNSGDTVKALYCNYTNTYNNSKEIRLTYCFSKKAIEKTGSGDVCFEYNDELFGLKQKTNFCFKKSDVIGSKVKIKGIE